jgi:hypothetical protein
MPGISRWSQAEILLREIGPGIRSTQYSAAAAEAEQGSAAAAASVETAPGVTEAAP